MVNILNVTQLLGALELGLIYSFVAVGVYLTFRILQFPDLTVDGSFPLGAAVFATLTIYHIHPLLSTFAAVLAGALSGWLTAWMSTRLKMLNLLSGILTMTALYSINLRVMEGRPNISLLGEPSFFSLWFKNLPPIFLLGLIGIAVVGVFYAFLSTHLGLAMRAAGSNPRMSCAQGIDDHRMVWLGLALSNGLVALGGVLFAQVNGFADVTMGVGTIIMGLAAVILGEVILPIRTVWQALLACVIGAILYRIVIAMALNFGDFGFQTSDTNLITAALVAFAMIVPTLKKKMINNKEVTL